MALRDELERSGNWLFRWRSYLPLLLIGIVVYSLKDYEYLGGSHRIDSVWEIICLSVSCIGLAIRVITVGHVRDGTSGRITRRQEAKRLNTDGIYSLVRHPLYLGNFFLWLGISLFPHQWWLTLLFCLIFFSYYERIMFAEEAFLRKKFGDEFEEWARRTPLLIPDFRNWRKPVLPFSLRTVLKREYSTVFALVCSFTFLEVVGDIFVEKKLELDWSWAALFSMSLVAYLTLRTLKKKSHILTAKDRS
ncbi:MAG: DUF1295 domain-containing protein [Candidatus Coatesbacteria bacterium]|nr:DUF1295 domain-containing protein [Candidatus Coatesbacteria bacterium]